MNQLRGIHWNPILHFFSFILRGLSSYIRIIDLSFSATCHRHGDSIDWICAHSIPTLGTAHPFRGNTIFDLSFYLSLSLSVPISQNSHPL